MVGDVNADGFADIMISESSDTGYLVLGSEEIGASGEVLVTRGHQDNVIKFRDSGQFRGFYNFGEVSDLNRDGFDDISVDWKVIFGGALDFQRFEDDTGSVDLGELFEAGLGFLWPDFYPTSRGDFDGDGSVDLVFSYSKNRLFDGGDDEEGGAIFVDLGSDSIDSKIDNSSADGGNGFLIHGPRSSRGGVASGGPSGDFNGDSIDDLLFRFGGRVHVLFGSESFASARTGSVAETIDLPAGGEVTYHVQGIVPPQSSEVISFSATVTSAEDTSLANNEATTPNIKVKPAESAPEVDVSVALDDGKEHVFPGNRITYQVTIENQSDVFAESVSLSVVLDASLSDPMWRSPTDPQPIRGDLNTTVNLAPRERLKYEVSATVGPKVGELTSSARVTASRLQQDTNESNNESVGISVAPLRYQVPEFIGYIKPCFEDTATIGDRLVFAGVTHKDECFASRSQASSGFYGGHLYISDGTQEGTTVLLKSRPDSEEIRWDRPGPANTFPEARIHRISMEPFILRLPTPHTKKNSGSRTVHQKGLALLSTSTKLLPRATSIEIVRILASQRCPLRSMACLRWTTGCCLQQTTVYTAGNFGDPTEPRKAPCWSRISTRVPKAGCIERPTRTKQNATVCNVRLSTTDCIFSSRTMVRTAWSFGVPMAPPPVRSC